MKPTKIFLHHVGFNHSFYTVNAGHKKKGYPKSELGWNIGYHKFIRNGKLWLGRKETEVGMHNIGHNEDSLALAFDKNHDIIPLSNQDAKVAEKELLAMMKRWDIPIKKVYSHTETDNTICPGKYVVQFLEDFKRGKPIETPSENKEELKTKISIIQKMIKIYTTLLNLLRNSKGQTKK